MAKRKQAEQKSGAGSEKKTNIGVLLPVALWKRFRVHCLENDV